MYIYIEYDILYMYGTYNMCIHISISAYIIYIYIYVYVDYIKKHMKQFLYILTTMQIHENNFGS